MIHDSLITLKLTIFSKKAKVETSATFGATNLKQSTKESLTLTVPKETVTKDKS
jgi:hypothetical protein